MEIENSDPLFDSEYYYCEDCENEISTNDIKYDEEANRDICPECGSCNVDYYNNSSDY